MDFKLSFDAREFVPSFNQQQAQQSSVSVNHQHHGGVALRTMPRPDLMGSKINPKSSLAHLVHVPEFVPKSTSISDYKNGSEDSSEFQGTNFPFSCETPWSTKPTSIRKSKATFGSRDVNVQAKATKAWYPENFQYQPETQKRNRHFRNYSESSEVSNSSSRANEKPNQNHLGTAPVLIKPHGKNDNNNIVISNNRHDGKISHAYKKPSQNNEIPKRSGKKEQVAVTGFRANEFQNASTTHNESDTVKSWRDVVRSRPTISPPRCENDRKIYRTNENKNFQNRQSQQDQAKQYVLGSTNRSANSLSRNRAQILDGRAKPDSHDKTVSWRNPNFSEQQNSELPEWRRRSQNNCSGLDKKNNQESKPSRYRNNWTFYRDKNRRLKCFELEHVPSSFADYVKRKLFHKNYEDDCQTTTNCRNLDGKCRGWYQRENSVFDDVSLEYNTSKNQFSNEKSDTRRSTIYSSGDNTSISAKNRSLKLENNRESVFKNLPGSKATDNGWRYNTDKVSYGTILDPSKRQRETEKGETVVRSDIASKNQNLIQEKMFVKKKEENLSEHLESYSIDRVQGHVSLEQGTANDDDEWTDDDGWVTVVDKSNKKKLRSSNLDIINRSSNINSKAAHFQMRGRSFSSEERKSTEKSKNEKSDKKPETKVKKKKTNKRKKSKRKENVLYDNDEKKIKEFKMRQVIEEGLKQNLLELTRKKNKFLTNENDDVKGNENNEDNDWPSIGTAQPSRKPVMSYMDALVKSAPSPKPLEKRSLTTRQSSTLTSEERQELRRKKLKEKRKEKKKERKQRKQANVADGDDPSMQTVSMLSRQGFTLDLGGMFDKLTQPPEIESEKISSNRNKSKRNVVSAGVVSVASGLAKKKSDSWKTDSKVKLSSNALDSTQPARMRGKERETPKKKKLTLLKRVIIREREAKKRLREAEQLKVTNEEKSAKSTEYSNKENCLVHDEERSNFTLADVQSTPMAINKSKTENNIVQTGEEKSQKSEKLATSKQFSDVPKDILSKLHSRKFRDYCDHFLSKEIDDLVQKILKDLLRFQTRAFIDNPIKAKSKRRFVLGLREVLKHVKMKRLKCVIMAPNLERISAEGGIDDTLANIITECKNISLMIVYSKSRQTLGMTLNRKVPVSAIGIFNYDGTEDNFNMMKTLVDEQREKYRLKVAELMSSLYDVSS